MFPIKQVVFKNCFKNDFKKLFRSFSKTLPRRNWFESVFKFCSTLLQKHQYCKRKMFKTKEVQKCISFFQKIFFRKKVSMCFPKQTFVFKKHLLFKKCFQKPVSCVQRFVFRKMCFRKGLFRFSFSRFVQLRPNHVEGPFRGLPLSSILPLCQHLQKPNTNQENL